ncbi:hypothetical protein PAP18089_03211 [Pandoraea apista]|uniref:Uncharacterized protein n=1 Tax=Pandoraea apista TaxID=93218 RepID=A0A5E5P6C8_9BURK|nr:hypothetical protein LMG16407_01064 [Pandoraea apista]VVG72218.1 hypothetical protein PAP18089_03211 [Pandoraea apista]
MGWGLLCDGLVTVGTWASRAEPVAKFLSDMASLLM